MSLMKNGLMKHFYNLHIIVYFPYVNYGMSRCHLVIQQHIIVSQSINHRHGRVNMVFVMVNEL